jgi:hypothetical protein
MCGICRAFKGKVFPIIFCIFVASVVVSCEVQEITSLLPVLSSILSDRNISLRIQPEDKLNVQFIAKSISNLIVNLSVDEVFCICFQFGCGCCPRVSGNNRIQPHLLADNFSGQVELLEANGTPSGIK